ncbi:MarR family transcriptional regulator [Tersicoccus solisilvae]|uniref:MarR family transcriptional regulator n=1 Tax=Tersicoccus solisilvae TaxID=1882339 RepID=A0ABQ1NPL1_9MICC|nr:MarR family transcriptional regulator [Tersicoccus solisilvae]GGC79389.1 MarR family transcriptional regulator [Tersicoccus solisilvae]
MSDAGNETPDEALYRLDASDPHGRLVDRSGLRPEDIAQIDRLMKAMGRLSDVERRMGEEAQRYMRLNETDMRALYFLIVAANRGADVTPSMLSRHLGIASASTTKMLDRLEAAGHVTRHRHPTDRRSVAIRISPQTHETAMNTVGPLQARRYGAAAELTPREREIVIRFLDATAAALTGPAADAGTGGPGHTGP